MSDDEKLEEGKVQEEERHIPAPHAEEDVEFREKERQEETLRKEKFKDYRRDWMRHNAHFRKQRKREKFLGGVKGRRKG